jgi:hypothetical protein
MILVRPMTLVGASAPNIDRCMVKAPIMAKFGYPGRIWTASHRIPWQFGGRSDDQGNLYDRKVCRLSCRPWLHALHCQCS